MSRASSATAPRVGQLTRHVTVERPLAATHVTRAPGRLPFAPDFAVVPATALPAAADGAGLAVLAAGAAAGAGAAVVPLASGVVSPPAGAGASPVPRSVAVLSPAAVLLSGTVSCALRWPPPDGGNCTPTPQGWARRPAAPGQGPDPTPK